MKNANFIWNFIIDDKGLAKKAQVGVDLTLATVAKISSGGRILSDDTAKKLEVKATKLGFYSDCPPIRIKSPDMDEAFIGWQLDAGVYSIGFDQGLKSLPANCNASIIQRSSLGRNGAMIRSSVYDPGFETPQMGAILYVYSSLVLTIEQHARVAQIVFHENEDSSLYEGQWQGQ